MKLSRSETFPAAAAILLGIGFLFGGCVTPEAAEPDPLGTLAEEVIGTVTMVDAEENLAIVQMGSSRTRPGPALVARNEAMVETARLEPTRFQRGRTLGTRILSGLPNVGDEVVAAP